MSTIPTVAGYGKASNSLLRSIGDQFRLPKGLAGRFAGWWMSRENARMNRLAIRLLDVNPSDSVLELGFGPGQAIKLLAEHTPAALIAGVDPSDVMLEQARCRNREAVESGRVRLERGAVEELPFDDHQFSKVLAVSNFHEWRSRVAGLAQVRRVLKPGGLLLIGLRRAAERPSWFSKPGVTPQNLTADIALLNASGFSPIRMLERNFGQGVVCLIARAE